MHASAAFKIAINLTSAAAADIIQDGLHILKIHSFVLGDIKTVPVDRHIAAAGYIHAAAISHNTAVLSHYIAAAGQSITPIRQQQHSAAQQRRQYFFRQKSCSSLHLPLPPRNLTHKSLYAKNHSLPFLSCSSLWNASPLSLRA